MNSLDLTLSAINGVPEKIPFNPYIMHMAATLQNISYNHEFCRKPEILADAMIKCSDYFGIDHVNVSTDAYREANAWGVEIDWSSHTPIAKKYLEIEKFESIEIPDILENVRIQNRVKAVKILAEKVGGTQCIVGWIEAPFNGINSLFGLVNVLKLCRYPDWDKKIRDLVARIMPVQKEFAQLQFEAGAHIIGAGESAASQIGPMRYEKCFVEATRELINYIQKDVPAIYHVCGNNALIDKEGRDMIKIISSTNAAIIDFDYQVDLELAKEKINNNNCIRGNSNTQILGSPEYSPLDVINEVSKTLEKGKPGGKFMYAAGCEWPWEPLEMSSRNLGIAKALTEKLGYY